MFYNKSAKIMVTPKIESRATFVGAVGDDVGEIPKGFFVTIYFKPVAEIMVIAHGRKTKRKEFYIPYNDIISFKVFEFESLLKERQDIALDILNKKYFGYPVMEVPNPHPAKKDFCWYGLLEYKIGNETNFLLFREFMASSAKKSNSSEIFEAVIDAIIKRREN